MSIEVDITFPPHREDRVAEFHVLHDQTVDIPAEIFRRSGQLTIAIYSKSDGISWEYPVADFLSAIAAGIAIIEE